MKTLLPEGKRRSNPFNSLFGRMVLLMAFLLVADHLVWIIAVGRLHPHEPFDTLRSHTLLVVSAISQAPGGDTGRFAPALKAALRDIRQVPYDDARAPAPAADRHAPPELRALLDSMRDDLPPGSEVRMVAPPHAGVWVHVAGAPDWIVIPGHGPPFGGPLVDLTIAMALAILCAIFGAWQMQMPLRELARAATHVHPDRHAGPVRERGPSEVRRVIRHFNDTARELSQLESDRAVMLAGVAHDLRAPITRVRARADIVGDSSLAVGFIRDAASMSQIVDQFLDFSRVDGDGGPLAQVDAFCRARWGDEDADTVRADAITLKLAAGAGFRLPATDLDRILSNLTDNALAHGASPIEIVTAAQAGGGWLLSVRDSGDGIPEQHLAAVTRPFVRLDPSRGGTHCGLGLSIVNNLALRHGGTLVLENASGGGLHATLLFPAEPA